MPASARSFTITDAYRDRLRGIRERTQARAMARWPTIDALDGTDWVTKTAQTLSLAQTEAARASAGYLTAYLSSELGRRVRGPLVDSRAYAGRSRDGRSLAESLESPLIGVRGALKEGLPPQEALTIGKQRALRMVEMDLMHAARTSLNDGMEADERIEGWQRAVRGTCGACMGDIAVEVSVELPSVPLMVHPNCQCVTQPVVVGAGNRFPLLTGIERFARMTRSEQDEGLGPEAAENVRNGTVALAALVEESEVAQGQNFVTQAPAKGARKEGRDGR